MRVTCLCVYVYVCMYGGGGEGGVCNTLTLFFLLVKANITTF